MLIDFSIQNFGSIATTQRLSMSAGRFRSQRLGAVLNTTSRTAPHLLRAAAIMGPNGAGKSTLIDALAFVQRFVAESAQRMQTGEAIPVRPFRLDEHLIDKPSEFVITFLCDDDEYQYSFSATRTRVVSEVLTRCAGKKAHRELFSRVFQDTNSDTWNLSGLPPEAELWKNSTRENALFLSTAVQLNSELLKAPFL